jgi:4-amino-4-deoxy-L-arabinose transferase-like glycosyltransferase
MRQGRALRVGMVAVLLAAFGLRLAYAFGISPFSDEYITMVAARAVLQTGAPVLPSGLFYDHGILYVYVDALFLGLMGFTVEIARMASVFIGALMVALVYTIGRRWFGPRAGLVAALLLTLGTDAIVWHGRARMYSLLQLCFLASVFFLYEGLVRQDNQRYRCLGVVAAGCAGLSHLLAIPYLGTVIVALVVVRWWIHRRGQGFPLRARRMGPELMLGLIGGGLVLLTRLWGGPWGATGRIVTDPAVWLDAGYLVSHGLAWMQLFLTWPDLIWTVFIIVGALAFLLRLARKASQQEDVPWVYLLMIWSGSVIGLGVFSVWYADNYVIGLLPLFDLLGGRELDGLCCAIEEGVGSSARRTVAWGATMVLIMLLLLLTGRSVLETVTVDTLQLDQALDYVRQRWQEGDTVAAFAPHASLVTLGDVDFYAQEMGFPSTETDLGRVDIWTGAPVLDSVEKLEHVLDTHKRVWLIVHRENWNSQRHYSDDYREVVAARMELVFDGAGTWVYLSEP